MRRGRLPDRGRTWGPALLCSLALACGGAAPEGPGPAPVAGLPPDPASLRDPLLLDDFEDPGLWEAAPASGVEMTVGADEGRDGGRALRVDFDFRGAGGWAAARRQMPLELPDNYELSFWIRGDAPANTFELKLVDPSGENVWWVRRPDFEFPGEWRRIAFRKRHVEFAWGPSGGGELREVGALELTVTAGTGGRGSVRFDRMELTPLEPVGPYDLVPGVAASSATDGHEAGRALDGDSGTAWRSAADGPQHLTLDFLRAREYGGVVIEWEPGRRARDYHVQVSADGRAWETVRSLRDAGLEPGGGRPRDRLQLPDMESRFLRLDLRRSASGEGYGVRELEVMPLDWGASPNTLFESVAAEAPRGHHPRYLHREQSYWTVVGVSGDGKEALVNEEGMVEPERGSFSLEPFLHAGGRLLTWDDARRTQSLEKGYLPVPSVEWRAGDLALTVTAWVEGAPGASTLRLRYRVEGGGGGPGPVTLYVALRPFQVNPSWQFLTTPGGVAPLRDVAWDGALVTVDGRRVVPLTPASGFGAATHDQGSVVEWLREGRLPGAARVTDDFGHASAALAFALDPGAGEAQEVHLAVPLHPRSPSPRRPASPEQAHAEGEASLAEAVRGWEDELDRFAVVLPERAGRIERTLRSNLAYILVNRDGPAIRPGTRSYARSWIRDGSLTSAALLRLGHDREVREFIDWYAPFQYADGKVPCCVDHRGADPVPEHDSHGQLLYLVAEYYRHTGDADLLERTWPRVEAAVAYIDSLRHTRRTDEYRTPEKRAYFGLVPESISHEGYADRPVHSYWDGFFVLRGLKDAAAIAEALGREEAHVRFAAIRDGFRRDLLESLERSMALHGIDFLPGSVERGDFDPTSTTVGVAPAGELAGLPAEALRRTFARYWEEFLERRDGTRAWDAYTPYELRTVGTFVRMGDRRTAHELLDWFFQHQRPPGWNHWAEVVTRDPREPRFLGDMPHTWVGSDYIRSVTDMFAYEREEDGALVVGAGILPEWLEGGPGVSVRGLGTHYGSVAYTMRRHGDELVVELTGELTEPPGGVVLQPPLDGPIRRVTVDGRPGPRPEGAEVRVRGTPREVRIGS